MTDGMSHGDYIVLYVNDDGKTAYCEDRYGDFLDTPGMRRDRTQDCTNVQGYADTEGFSVASFERVANTGDRGDVAFSPGTST